MGGVGVEEAAAVVAQLLDEFLRGDRAVGDRLLRAFEGGDRLGRVPRLRHTLPDQHEGSDEGDRQQDVQHAAGQVDPVVADRGRAAPRETAEQGDRDGQAGGGRGEVADGEDGGLGQVRRARLTGVVLPVRVGLEADGRVERELRGHGRDARLVERQDVLEAEHDIAGHDRHEGHHEDRDRIALPALLGGLVDPAQAIDRPLDGPDDRAEEDALPFHHPMDVSPDVRRREEDRRRQGGEDEEVVGCHGQKSSGRSSAHSR